MILRNPERLTRLEETIIHQSFMFNEFAIGIVDETAEEQDHYATDRLARTYNHIEKLKRIKQSYSRQNWM